MTSAKIRQYGSRKIVWQSGSSWLSRPLMAYSAQTNILTLNCYFYSRRTENHEISIYFSTNAMSCTAITLKFKMHLFPNEGHHCAEMLSRCIIFALLMSDEDRNFGGSLRLDLKAWWRHVKTFHLIQHRIIKVVLFRSNH